jgi:hypothetical protein
MSNRCFFPCSEWEELDDQASRASPKPEAEGVPGEHIHLIALLNRLGFNPMSKSDATRLAEQLLENGWK